MVVVVAVVDRGRRGGGGRPTRDYEGWEEYLRKDESAANPKDVARAKNRMRKDQAKMEHKMKKGTQSP